MRIETHVNLKNGQAVILPEIPKEFNDSFFKTIEQIKRENGNVMLYGSNGVIPINANEIKSIEFVII